MSDEDVGDSIRALERVARSQRVRAVFSAVWPYLLPVLTLVGGWLVRGAFLADQLEKNTEAVTALRGEVAALRSELKTGKDDTQRRIIAVGRYAAYASAGFQAGETPKVKQAKRDYADKYAAAFQRIAEGEQKGPEVALVALFESVSPP